MGKQPEMLPRTSIKKRARARFLARYRACVCVMLVMVLASFAPTLLRGWLQSLLGKNAYLRYAFSYVFSFAVTMLYAIMYVDVCCFFLRVYREEKAEFAEFLAAVKQGADRKIKGALWRSLYLFVWEAPVALAGAVGMWCRDSAGRGAVIGREVYMLLLLIMVVAGIGYTVKVLSYSQQYYILRDCPQVSARESLRLSARMMNGHKGRLFVFLLSFLGWALLAAAPATLITVLLSRVPYARTIGMLVGGVIACFFMGQYIFVAQAGFYDALKRASIAAGVISDAEFGPGPARERGQ